MEVMSVYYFGGQCPWNSWAIGEAKKAAGELGMAVRELDISHGTADIDLYFPFTIALEELKIAGPVPAKRLVEIIQSRGNLGFIELYKAAPNGSCTSVIPYTQGTFTDACGICTNGSYFGLEEKKGWISKLDLQHTPLVGAVGYSGDKPVAFCEAIPSLESSYAIAAESETAFITCIYNGMSEEFDYRADLFGFLFRELKYLGYSKVNVLAGIRSPFPNGPEQFFREHGFERIRKIPGTVVFQSGADEIVLLSKEI